MDTRGAVDLTVDATWMHAPKVLSESAQRLLLGKADAQWALPPEVWLESQLVRLALASIIEARLLHVRQQRLQTFDLPKDPSVVTLKHLAALWRSHAGAVGQAFELAVADAVGHGVPEVIEPLAEALRLLGIDATEPMRMVLVGLEKVPADLREVAAINMLSVIPEGTVLRTGQPGRPLSASTTAARLTQATWTDMSRPPSTQQETDDLAVAGINHAFTAARARYTEMSQLARADALLVAGRAMVGVSMKVNWYGTVWSGARYGWRDVPLWITRAPSRVRRTQVRQRREAKVPMVVVELADNRWTRCFETALRVLEEALYEIDLGRPRRVTGAGRSDNPTLQAQRLLVKRAHLPVNDITSELRDVHATVAGVLSSKLRATTEVASVMVVDDPTLVRAWKVEGVGGGVYAGQQHLFFGGREAS